MTLRSLWEGTRELFNRFDLVPTIDAQLRKFHEEVYEFTREVTIFSWVLSPSDVTREHVLEEFVDVMVVGIVILQRMGFDYFDIQHAIDKVVEKNNAKTHLTHEVRNHQIVRKNVTNNSAE